MAHTIVARIRRPLALAALICLVIPAELWPQASEATADTTVVVLRPEPLRLAQIDVPVDPSVAHSPDGSFVAVLQTRPQPLMWIVPTDGGKPFAYRKTWSATMLRWARSGNRIGFVADGGPPRIWTIEVDPVTGRPTDPPRMLYRDAVNAYTFSPDGEWIAYVPRRTTAAGASAIHLVEWESRKVRVVLREDGMIYRLDWSPDGEFIYYGLTPGTAEASRAHQVRRVAVRDGSSATVLSAGEFLGLSSDGLYLLCRPAGWSYEDGNVVELAGVDGRRLMRIEVEPGPAPRWGAVGPGSIIQVLPTDEGNAIWAIPACPFCYILPW